MMLANLKEYLQNQKIAEKFEVQLVDSGCKDELTAQLKASKINDFLHFLKNDKQCQFQVLLDICGADYPQKERRFEVVYHLLSVTLNQRIRVKICIAEREIVPSVVSTYKAAGWYERETWDLYGIYFSGNDDLRRILTDYGFEGHPMRKDFPLTGYVEVRYDAEKQSVVYEPTQLTQEFRKFDFLRPWDGTEYIFPGDEKATK